MTQSLIPAVADGYERESVYVAMQDGCRIAVDVLHPAKGGRRLDGEFPTVLHATPYRRSFVITGLATTAAVYAEELADLQSRRGFLYMLVLPASLIKVRSLSACVATLRGQLLRRSAFPLPTTVMSSSP